MQFSKKIAIFDLDGTLAESKQALSEEIAELLHKLAAQKKVAVISGGSFAQFEKQFFPMWNKEAQVYGFDVTKNLIILPTSGAQCYEYDQISNSWKQIYAETFPTVIKEQVTKVLQDIIASENFGIPKEHYGEYIEDRGSQITFSAFGQDAPLEKKKLWDPDQRKRKVMQSEIEKRMPEVSVQIGGTTTIDILPKGMNKAVAIRRLLERLHMTIADAIFVGDALYPGGNDSSMLETGMETIVVSGPEETRSLLNKWL